MDVDLSRRGRRDEKQEEEEEEEEEEETEPRGAIRPASHSRAGS